MAKTSARVRKVLQIGPVVGSALADQLARATAITDGWTPAQWAANNEHELIAQVLYGLNAQEAEKALGDMHKADFQQHIRALQAMRKRHHQNLDASAVEATEMLMHELFMRRVAHNNNAHPFDAIHKDFLPAFAKRLMRRGFGDPAFAWGTAYGGLTEAERTKIVCGQLHTLFDTVDTPLSAQQIVEVYQNLTKTGSSTQLSKTAQKIPNHEKKSHEKTWAGEVWSELMRLAFEHQRADVVRALCALPCPMSVPPLNIPDASLSAWSSEMLEAVLCNPQAQWNRQDWGQVLRFALAPTKNPQFFTAALSRGIAAGVIEDPSAPQTSPANHGRHPLTFTSIFIGLCTAGNANMIATLFNHPQCLPATRKMCISHVIMRKQKNDSENAVVEAAVAAIPPPDQWAAVEQLLHDGNWPEANAWLKYMAGQDLPQKVWTAFWRNLQHDTPHLSALLSKASLQQMMPTQEDVSQRPAKKM